MSGGGASGTPTMMAASGAPATPRSEASGCRVLPTLDGIPLATFNFLMDACADLLRAGAALVPLAQMGGDATELLEFGLAQEQAEMAVALVCKYTARLPALDGAPSPRVRAAGPILISPRA